MSDFTSDFWNWYVIGITVLSIAFCAWLLLSMAKVKAPAGGKVTTAPAAGGKEVEITGHVWDGDLAEYNNPLPRWWMWLFWITIVFSLGYLALYPGLGTFPGVLGWTSTGAYAKESAEMDAKVKPLYDKYLAMDLQQVAADPQRARWASACSSTTARSATAPTPAAARASRTCATRTGCTAARPRRSSSRSPTAAWA